MKLMLEARVRSPACGAGGLVGLKRRLGTCLAVGALGGCGDTGQERVAMPLLAAGTAIEEPVETRGGEATLERADLAFGPLYLCPGQQAGELCETARLEWLDSAVVDTLDPEPARVGELSGVTGPVRSYMYDYGITSLLTRDAPLVLPAAEQLGSVSLRLDGTASTGIGDVPFSAAVVVAQGPETEPGVPVVRKSASESFAHVVGEGEPGLVVRFDPRSWLAGVDFSAFIEDELCADGDGQRIVCAGFVEQTCAVDGSLVESRDCAALGEICQMGVGCTERVWIEAGAAGYQSIENALVVGRRPSFDFGGVE